MRRAMIQYPVKGGFAPMKKWTTALLAFSFLCLCLGLFVNQSPWRLVLCTVALVIPVVLLVLSFRDRK